MTRKFFGTDGIRGTVGTAPITPDFVLRLGYAAGKEKVTCILLDDGEPELMNRMADHICTSVEEVIDALSIRGGRVVK